MRNVGVALLGAVAGIVLFCTGFYVWLIWGADPEKDPLLSW